jgi:cytochrome c-type biogenesis protein CcmH
VSERLLRLLSLLVTLGLAGFLVVSLATAPARSGDRAISIGERVRCPVCQGESIAESPAALARDMMGLVRQRVAEGWSDDQIIGELLGSYSGAALLDPPLSGATLWLWLAPLAVLGVGIMAAARLGRPRQPTDASEADEGLADAPRRSGTRAAVGGAAVVVAVALAVGAIGQFRQDRSGDFVGVAALPDDLSEVSAETMEAVVAANSNHPQINGMRVALAERYFEGSQYSEAAVHYQAVLESNPPPQMAALALARLGWMVFDGNGQVDLATDLFDRALEADPDDPLSLYLKGRVRWCGAGETESAADLFRQVLDNPGLDPEERSAVESDLAEVEAGRKCA